MYIKFEYIKRFPKNPLTHFHLSQKRKRVNKSKNFFQNNTLVLGPNNDNLAETLRTGFEPFIILLFHVQRSVTGDAMRICG